MQNQKGQFMILALTIIVFSILISVDCYPLLTNDTECFLPASFEIKYFNGLYNHIYNGNVDQNFRFLFYPPGFPKFISLFLLKKSIVSLYFVINGITCISILIQLYSIYTLLKKWNVKIGILSLFIVFTCILSFNSFGNSRPELLGQLIYSIVILIYLKNIRYKFFIYGILTAILIWISPILGIYLGLLSIIFYLLEFQRINQTIIQYFLGFIIIFIVNLLNYEYSIVELFKGMNEHSINVIFNRSYTRDLSSFMRYHVINTNGSFGFVLFLFSLIVFYKHLRLKKRSIALWAACLILGFSIVYFGFRIFEMSYYVYSLSPFMILLMFKAYSQANFRNPLITSVFLLCSISFVYSFTNYLLIGNESKKSLKKAISVINELPEYSKIGLSNSYWPLIYQLKNKQISLIQNNNIHYDYIIQQQYTTGMLTPKEILGFELIENFFMNSTIPILHFELNYSPKYYQFALYKRKKKL